jgi:hypothetical protein
MHCIKVGEVTFMKSIIKMVIQKRRECLGVLERLLAFSGIVCDACSHLPYVQARFRITCHDHAITLMTVTSLVSVEYSEYE